MRYTDVVEKLKSIRNPKNIAGMARFGINPKNTLGIPIPFLRNLAKEIKKTVGPEERHNLAQKLWDCRIHEARILAGFIDEPKLVTEKQMDLWVADFDSWDTCDQVCMNLFDKTEFAYQKAIEYSGKREEFVKRAGFALMASLSFHDKIACDEKFLPFLPVIKKASTDERNFVRKAVNWALRQIGKRNKRLNKEAIAAAKEIIRIDSKSARWIASDAIRELENEAVQKRLVK